LKVDRIYRDNGASGKDTNRPALAELRADLNQIGVVIVYKFDRISRSVVDLYGLLEEFQACGVTFKSVSEGVDTGSAIGKFMMNILAGLAQMERELIGERTRDTLAHKRHLGEHCGRIPFGYRIGEDRRLVKDQNAQALIARMKRLHREGKSYREISRRVGVNYRTVCNLVRDNLGSRNRRYISKLVRTTGK